VSDASRQDFSGRLRRAFGDDLPILKAWGLIGATLLAVLRYHGIEGLGLDSWTENLEFFLLALGICAAVLGCSALFRDRPERPIRYLYDKLTETRTLVSLLGGIPMLAMMIIWIPIFSATKTAIPLVHAFTWDARLAAADRFLLGDDAWRVFQPILGYPIVTSALAYLYHTWIALIYGGGVCFCFLVGDRELRAQYFITRFSVWSVLGLGVAAAFASVGPCFVGPILGDHQFDAQLEYLRMANTHHTVLVLPVQQLLLESYRLGGHGLGGGIAAMPSMHVSMTLLTALGAWRLSRVAGAIAYASVAVIFLGSFHLGYHYAVDGLVAIAGTCGLWWLAGIWARRIVTRPEAAAAVGPACPEPAPAIA
jgi:hypothetical protein